MDDELLPFGRTRVDFVELQGKIQIQEGIELAKQNRLENAETRIQLFVEHIPDLLRWLEVHGRKYPWRETIEPWRVYLTEILLQRTRADAVAKIYHQFFDRFPDPESLHEAPESEIKDLVRTLGFVNHRTKSLQDVGEILIQKHGGSVPDSVEALKEPWRVGEYSARACQLFARDQPYALIDANFARVIGRVLGYEMPRQPHKSEDVYAFLDALVPSDPDLARAFNLAVLDLGALICTPDNPNHVECPFQDICVYFQNP